MNHQQCVDWHIVQLQQGNNFPTAEMPEQMQDYIAQHPELQQELDFISAFWQHSDIPAEQPSQALQQNFYHMLEGAKATQQHQGVSQPQPSSETGVPMWQRWSQWLTVRPAVQFASLALVFLLGFSIQGPGNNQGDEAALDSLQQQVTSLSTLVAMSMLQRPSASEKLSGIAYSRHADLTDPRLSDKLLQILRQDSSTAVRLAVINTLAELNHIDSLAAPLTTLAVEESTPLVQMELCRLLLSKGSSMTRSKLLLELEHVPLDPDVASFLEQITANNRA